MRNITIRDAMRQNGFFGYQVAAELGLAESSFSRKLAREELSEEEKQKILDAVEHLKEQRDLNECQ